MTTSFLQILHQHAARYPLMTPTDYGKLAYQSEFGPGHMISDKQAALSRLLEEWQVIAAAPGSAGTGLCPERRQIAGGDAPSHAAAPTAEPIGDGLCRFHLNGDYNPAQAAPLLTELFSRTALEHTGTKEGLAGKLSLLGGLSVPGMAQWLKQCQGEGCPPVHHSTVFREAYHPHYRVLDCDYANFFPALLPIWELMQSGVRAVVAIDGRCGSGKTEFASLVERLFPCNVLHLDDFYLPFDARDPNWEQLPGGNIDFERLLEQTILPARRGEQIEYRSFDCATQRQNQAVILPPRRLTVVEGSYSLHPRLVAQYDKAIFLTCSKERQMHRLKRREGDASRFKALWIPMEERYLECCNVRQTSDLTLDTSDFF